MADMASYGGQQANSTSQQQQQQGRPQNTLNAQTGLPLKFHQQLTPQEVQTMTAVRRNASVARSTGGILGASAAGFYMLRKKTTLLSFRYLMGCFGGSLLGSWLFVPIGVFWSTSTIRKVENPDHLVDILTQAQKEQMRSKSPEGGPNKPYQRPGPGSPSRSEDPASQSMSSSPYPPAPRPLPTRTTTRTKGTSTNQWGDEINGPEMPSYSNDTANSPPAYQYTATASTSASNPNGMTDSEAGQSSESQSRWAQLRKERQVQESSWEKIRQENARDAYNRQAASGQGRPDQVAFSQGPSNYAGQSNSVDMADPNFGKGPSPSRSQAQREYERSFERERRGVDG